MNRTNSNPPRAAIGLIRVSRVGGREGESFVTEQEQRKRIEQACEREGLALLTVYEEEDVSGGAPLAKRPGLRQAVEAVEAGEAEVVVVAYFDRLVRSLTVQAEVVQRVEQAGGRILAVDIGEVRADTASRWLSSTMLGLVAEYHRRTVAERTAAAKVRAVARGVAPFPNIPPGYRIGVGNHIEPDPDTAPIVAEAFRMRADGATIAAVREYLRERGITRSYHGTQAMLGSRFVLGELRFGKLVNKTSHEPIVDRDTWRRAQQGKVLRGRRAKSERLLARLGVLRCGTCGARLVVGFRTTRNGKRYDHYRCPPVGDCPRRVTISAQVAERAVVEEVKRLLRGITGAAAMDSRLAEADAEVERAEAELDAAVRAFSALDDVESAQDRLRALREARDRARDHRDELRAAVAPVVSVSADDWDDFTLEEQRSLIRAVIARAVVIPGSGPERIRIEPRT